MQPSSELSITNPSTLLALLRRSLSDWLDDDAQRLGASLAFYTILSISPLVVLLVAIVSLVFDRSSAQARLLTEVQAWVGADGREAVRAMLASSQKASSGVVATVLGLSTLAFGATGVFAELRSALNLIWEAKPAGTSGIWGFLRERFFSLGMVLSVGFLLLVSLIITTALAAATKFFGGLLPIPSIALGILNFVISLGGISLLFGLVFKYVPETTVSWQDVRVGAVGTALLFVIGKTLLGLYIGRTSPGSTYGAAGSLVVLVTWVYYSAQIFFFGAEFTHVHALARRNALDSEKKSSA